MARETETLEVAGREVEITNPGKVFFPDAGHTKLRQRQQAREKAPTNLK